MRGHITKRAKDSYSIKVSVGKDATTGKYKYQWATVKGTKKDAEKRQEEAEEEATHSAGGVVRGHLVSDLGLWPHRHRFLRSPGQE